MPQRIFSDVQILGAGGDYDIRPPAGSDYEVTMLGSSVILGVQPNQRPGINVGIFDGTNGPANVLRSTDMAGWYREQRLSISRGNYVRVHNPNLVALNLSFSVKTLREYGAGNSIVMSDVQPIAAAAALQVRPPDGEDWVITAIGSDQWIGAAPAGLPNVRVDMTDGTDTAVLLQPTEQAYQEIPLEIYVNHDNYVNLVNTAGVQADVGFTARIHKSYGAGNSHVRSDLAQCAALGSVDFQPPAGEEWLVRHLGAANWFGVSPLMFPDCSIGVFDATTNSLIADRTNWRAHGHVVDLRVDNSTYIRFTDTSNAINDVAISAVLCGQY